jgi:hypothetical protein
MKLIRTVVMAIAATATAAAAVAQSAGQAPPAQPAGAAAAGQEQTVNIVGCIQREEDYRKAQAAGKGGVASTGVGAGNEFVLTNAMMATGGAKPETPTGTAGAAGSAFELTGSGEGQAAAFVGQRVEIAGKVKATSGAGGPTAAVPGSADLQLREIDVTSVKASTSGTCPAAR